MRIGDDEALALSRRPDDRERTAFSLADRGKPVAIVGTNREYVTLLRLIAPDLPRGHAGLYRR